MTKEQAIEVIKAYRDKLTNSASNQLDGDIEAFEMAIQALSQEQKSGKWIITPFSVTGRHYQCSECRYIHTFTNFEYCPKCGAKMVEPQERSDKE